MKRGIFALCILLFIQPNTAHADLDYLNNGIISFAGAGGGEDFVDDNWNEVYLYRTPYTVASTISLTNGDGWGVTVADTVAERCSSLDSDDSCGDYDDGVSATSTYDYSGLVGFTVDGNNYTYGTVVETTRVTIDGKLYELVSRISLEQDASYAVVTTTLQNLSGAPVSNINLVVNNYDGMLNNDSQYRSTRGNVIDGVFVPITDSSQASNAVLVDAQTYGHIGSPYGAILMAGPNPGSLTSILSNGCCTPEDVVFETQTQLTQTGQDGQYAVSNALPTLAAGDKYTLMWAFGGGLYTTVTSAEFLNTLSAKLRSVSIIKNTPAPSAPVRQSTNLTFANSIYGTDTLSDPDGSLRKLVDELLSKFGPLIE